MAQIETSSLIPSTHQVESPPPSLPLPATCSGPSDYRRLYFIPFAQDEICLCGHCFETGSLSENKSREDIIISIEKAQRGEYQGVIFPCYFLKQKDAFYLMSVAAQKGLAVFVQVSALAWMSEFRQALQTLVSKGVYLNVIIGQPGIAEDEFLDYIQSHAQYAYYTLVGHEFGALPQYIAHLPQSLLNQLHFYFPLDPIETRRMFSTGGIYQTLKKISNQVRKSGKYLAIRGPKGVDIYEPYIPNDRELEPELEPIIKSQVESRDPLEVSVIIPTFNSRLYLKNVVRHLFKQDLRPEQYEVIVVDDGSNDHTQDEFCSFAGPHLQQRNFQFYFFSRLTPRRRGDSQFRAGIARNLGVKKARGKILLFLDSDMLVPSHYLSDLIKKMDQFDVIQGKRLFLNEEVSNELTSYNLIDTEIDTYPEDPYWAAFQTTQDWNTLHNHWKYTCTHSLAVRSADFKRLGWFRKTFLYYGFEDVDLGFRFAEDGARFLLNNVAVYHLHPPTHQSEYDRSPARRQMILSKTCRIFFHHSLNESAFQDFRGLLSPTDSFHLELPRFNPRLKVFWLHHHVQMMKWRIMWFLFHPAPKAGVRLTGGLLRRSYWSLIWPLLCWVYWRLKVLANWAYWRGYGLSGLLRWKIWGTLKWKLAYPFYFQGVLPTYYRGKHEVYHRGLVRFFWRFVWPSFCWLRWRYQVILHWLFWRIFTLKGFLGWKVWGTFKYQILFPLIYRGGYGAYYGIRRFYQQIIVPGLWLIFDLSLPLRKPYYMIRYQYRKRILRWPNNQLR